MVNALDRQPSCTAQPAAPCAPRCLQVHVAATRQLSPTLRRVTLAGQELQTLAPGGPDEYFALLIPPPGHEAPNLAPGVDPRAAVAAIPEASRPHLRWYTVRHHRPARGEVDVDMVTHGDDGRASHWAAHARVGDPVGFREGASLYAPPAVADALLFAADESALPALGAILEAHPTGGPDLRAFVEVPHAEDIQDLDTTAAITWVVRRTAPPGQELLATIRLADVTPPDYAWVCGEAGTVARVRTHLLRGLGVPRARITHSGYWCLGRPRP